VKRNYAMKPRKAFAQLRSNISFPPKRARQTAKIVARTLKSEACVEEIEQLYPDQSVQDLLSALVDYAGQRNSIGRS